MIIAVDFDGVLCEKKWPDIGAPNKKLINHLKALQTLGHKIILWTCRTDDPFMDGRTGQSRFLLNEAIHFCAEQGLTFNQINEPDPDSLKMYGGNPRKIYAHVYIDDNNAGEEFMTRYTVPFVNAKTYQEEAL